jgi:hypothetical protein
MTKVTIDTANINAVDSFVSDNLMSSVNRMVKDVVTDIFITDSAEEVIDFALGCIAVINTRDQVGAVEKACLVALGKLGHKVETMAEALELSDRLFRERKTT